MTTEERLREAARYLRTQHPRPCSCGMYIDELMEQAADEMNARTRFVADLMLGTDEVLLDTDEANETIAGQVELPFEPWCLQD